MSQEEKIGLVLSGGGARGAYEIGALSILLPELERRGQRPNVIVGTSVGAINAAFLAASAHMPATEAVAAAREHWLGISWEKVVAHLIGTGSVLTAARYAGAVAGIPGVALESLLDPAPLGRTLDGWLDWDAAHRNVASETLEALALVTTSAMTAGSVVFWESRGEGPVESSAEIEYVGTTLGTEHVRASAAIPVAFPAVEIKEPRACAGYYFDGGTRLNTPLKPALDFGVDRIVVLATHAIDPRHDSNWHVPGRVPDVGDATVQLVFGALVDSLISDVRMLGKINLLVAGGVGEQAERYRRELGRGPYREIPYMFVAPPSRDRLGDIAAEVFAADFDRLGGFLRHPNIAVLARLLGGITEPHGELLSYLFFAPEFVRAAIEQGEADARAWLDRDWGEAGPWLVGPIEAGGR